jgi:hypothetical protein
MVRSELKIQEGAVLVCANWFQMVYEVTAAARISHGICHKILSEDLNMSCVTHQCFICPESRPMRWLQEHLQWPAQ